MSICILVGTRNHQATLNFHLAESLQYSKRSKHILAKRKHFRRLDPRYREKHPETQPPNSRALNLDSEGFIFARAVIANAEKVRFLLKRYNSIDDMRKNQSFCRKQN